MENQKVESKNDTMIESKDLVENQSNSKIGKVFIFLNKPSQINIYKNLACDECGKVLSTISSLALHMERHKNIITRKTFCCLVDNCKRSFLYICTLKKHFQKEHHKIYSQILEHFPGNQRSFLAIYKYLLTNPESREMVKIKNKSIDQTLHLKTNKEISFEIEKNTTNTTVHNERVCQNIKKAVTEGINYLNFSERYMNFIFNSTFNMIYSLQTQINDTKQLEKDEKTRKHTNLNNAQSRMGNSTGSF